MAICGLSVGARSRHGNLGSVCGCTQQAWQSVICLRHLGAGIAMSLSGCLEQG